MQIGQLSRQVALLPGSSGGFIGNTIDNPKDKTCKAIKLGYGVERSWREDEIYEEVCDVEEEVEVEK